MAYTITSESYERKLPKVTIEADSLDDIASLTDFEEGSTAVVGGTTYTLDSANGWIVPGGGGDGGVLMVTFTIDPATGEVSSVDKTYAEILTANQNGQYIAARGLNEGLYFAIQVDMIPPADSGDNITFSRRSISTSESAIGFTIYDDQYYIHDDDTVSTFLTEYPSAEVPG